MFFLYNILIFLLTYDMKYYSVSLKNQYKL